MAHNLEKAKFPLPSLILFGSLKGWPVEHQLRQVRSVLREQPLLSSVAEAIHDLPVLWRALAAKEPYLDSVITKDGPEKLAEWLGDGVATQQLVESSNALTMTMTIITQVVQYFMYLESLGGVTNHSLVLESVTSGGGIQGFCVGLLCALAVASGVTEKEVGKFAAISVRLAFCIGTYIDLDQALNDDGSKYCILAVRYKASSMESIQHIINAYPRTYITANRDVRDVTITTPSPVRERLAQQLVSNGFSVIDTGLSGRYHASTNKDVPQKILDVIQNHLLPGFGGRGLVRCNIDGELLSSDTATMTVLRSILVDRANWHSTVSKATELLATVSDPFILAIGEDAAPPSLSRRFPVTKISTIGSASNSLPRERSQILKPNLHGQTLNMYPENAIAVIGMSCKFPGAESIEEFWTMLTEGRSMLSQISSQRFKVEGLPRTDDSVSFWGNFVDDIDAFDHKFFSKSAREAASMDPQQRLLLQVAYHTLESSGYFADTPQPRNIGCYLGACSTDYDHNVASHPPTAYSTTGTLRAFLSGRISHYFGWTGPSVVFDTACSSSAVAIHMACKALQSNECSQALAGGVNLMTSPYLYENLSKAHFLSPTGATKPFDARADGYCRGEGIGLVMLKSLSGAQADHDDILGVIAGSAINQNNNCVPITVPHSDSQAELYTNVAKQAGISPQDMSFLEAHGTGTPVGDPIEMGSIRRVFAGPARNSPLFVSSVKGNIGHLEGASGVAALIKTALQIRYRTICTQASFQSLNPKIPALEPDNLCIPTTNRPIPGKFLTACVNNYGAAGSNAALMLLEPPTKKKHTPVDADSSIQRYPVQISASSVASLVAYCQTLDEYCQQLPLSSPGRPPLLQNLAFRLSRRLNQELGFMLNFTITSIADLRSEIQKQSHEGNVITKRPKRLPVVLCFGGQVSDRVALDKRIWQESALLRYHLDVCDQALRAMDYPGLYPGIFQQEPIADVVALHSMIFALQYSSARAWLDSGLKVDALVGHSFGQLTALCVSGVLSLRDSLKLIAGRAVLIRNFWGVERGAMVAVEAELHSVKELIRTVCTARPECRFEIACYNGPKSHIIVSDQASAHRLETELFQRGIRHKRLNVPYGFHSQFTEDLLPHLEELTSSLTFHDTKIPLETCSEYATWPEATPQLVTRHTRDPVFFGRAIERLQNRLGPCTWIEAGSDSSVIGMVRRALGQPLNELNKFFPAQFNKLNAMEQLVDTTVELWNCGQRAQFWNFHRLQASDYDFLHLPPYQFEKSRHWLELLPTSRNNDNTKTSAPASSATTEPTVLLRLVNDSEGQLFSIDPTSDEYQILVGGYVVQGLSQCPPTGYIEIALRAVRMTEKLRSDCVLSVSNFRVENPLGREKDRDISLHLERLGGVWRFCLTSKRTHQGILDQPAVIFHAGGLLSQQDSVKAIQGELARYDRLIGSDKVGHVWNDCQSELIQGSLVHKVLSEVVKYDNYYHGLKGMAANAGVVAGKVSVPDLVPEPLEKSVSQPHILESFIQVPMLHANCVTGRTKGTEALLLRHVDRIQWGPGFIQDHWKPSPEHTWDILAFDSAGTEQATYDIFVFDHVTRTLVLLILGAQFGSDASESLIKPCLQTTKASSKISAAEGKTADTGNTREKIQIYESSRQSNNSNTSTLVSPSDSTISSPGSIAATQVSQTKSEAQITKELFKLVAEHLEAEDELTMETNLIDLGLDSLLSIELGSDVRKHFSVDLDIEVIHSDFTFKDLLQMVTGTSKNSEVSGVDAALSSTESNHTILTPSTNPMPEQVIASYEDNGALHGTQQAFEEIRFEFDQYAEKTLFKDFWKTVYPTQANLVVSYVVEAFYKLGCDLSGLGIGSQLPSIEILPKHGHLLNRLYEILIDDGLIERRSSSEYTRTAKPVNSTPAVEIFEHMLKFFPANTSETRLINVTGSCLAECLTGLVDPLPLLFSNKTNRELVTDVYDNAPMCQASTLLLADYLVKVFSKHDGLCRILEVGAGTGGTSRYVVDFLTARGIKFEYTFTDISPSLVASAKKKFASKKDQMRFLVLDCNRPAPPEFLSGFHVVIATNCIHATPNAQSAAANIAPMLREDGILCLVEFTRGLYWFDLVYGLLDGWWLFKDGRQHALADEWFWNKSLRAAGYKHVSWTDGDSDEAKTMRLIAAFKVEAKDMLPKPLTHNIAKRAGIPTETLTWKRVGNLSLQADIYYPKSCDEFGKKRPIALIIHGGGHFLYSRRDVPMKHVRTLIQRGFLPVSIDYRLCPETTLLEGPMTDCREALRWARETLPYSELGYAGVTIDPSKLIAVGWSSGGLLAMTLGFTAAPHGIKPPDTILPFYPPTDLESELWDKPIYPKAAEESPREVSDILAGVYDEPIVEYMPVNKKKNTNLSLTLEDDRAKIILHMNWKAQTLPVMFHGLPSKTKVTTINDSSSSSLSSSSSSSSSISSDTDRKWKTLPKPPIEQIRAASPYWQILQGNYRTPTFIVHGNNDDWVPWQMSQRTIDALKSQQQQQQQQQQQGGHGTAVVDCGIEIADKCGHAFDLFTVEDPLGTGWAAVERAYDFVCRVLDNR